MVRVLTAIKILKNKMLNYPQKDRNSYTVVSTLSNVVKVT